MEDRTTVAWLLLAIQPVGREEPAELWNAISAMDWINHAMPLDEEIEYAVGVLLRFGLVSVTDGSCLALTAEGRALTSRCESRSLHAMWVRIADALPQAPAPGVVVWRFDEGVLAEANRRYSAEIRRHR